MARKSMSILYGVSFVLHASLGAGVAEIEPSKEAERLAITVVEAPKPKQQAKEEPPPPPPPPPAPAKPKSKPVAKAPEAAPEPAPAPIAAAPTFGIAMSGGVGMGGVAVPHGDSLHAPKAAVKRVAQAKTLGEPAPKLSAAACEEPASKPRPLSLDKPEYTEAARAAAIEGKVRVQLTVSAEGAVIDAQILEALDPGLDQAALTAVRAATFEPAVHCGKPVEATFVVSIRFSL